MRKKNCFSVKIFMAAAEEVMEGIWEADLGRGVIKKRLPLQQGKSGGARTIIFFKSANHVFFYDGWSKSGLSSKGTKEIEDDELAAYKKMANAFLAFSNKKKNFFLIFFFFFFEKKRKNKKYF
ncbi:type II toxin-antitoxin system RelE/ParE family toxin [Escherichia coli]|uniref:type II toxin-antitoxin system RelE/ParE family toxin n=1 Tax=Escherichia coli TaxID=562 RepID=UPI0037DDE25F